MEPSLDTQAEAGAAAPDARPPAAAAGAAAPAAASEADPDLVHLRRLRRLLARKRRAGGWSSEELLELPRLYRHACSVVARLEASGTRPRLAAETRALVSAAHAVLYRHARERPEPWPRSLARLVLAEAPRTIRAEWRLLAVTFALVYGLALLAWTAVSRDLDLASSLLPAAVVEQEIADLRATPEGQPFRGNFDFGFGESPGTAGMIMVHNMGVGVLFFASALVPPLYLLVITTNGLMLGTYTAVAGHWGQAGAISSILWCHGTLEIQALILAGAAGLVLVRAWIRPGAWSRRHALVLESRVALRLLAPVFPLLLVAGLIEGFVSPHAPLAARLAVAIASGAALLAWALLGGRSPSPAPAGYGATAQDVASASGSAPAGTGSTANATPRASRR